MSALTFETLSAELTQALSERTETPPGTVVRCTLGRDKVMVLVEYPLDSADVDPFAHQTLDWLEQDLRSRFDTSGLPDEVADLSDTADEVVVQLYLKHLSEAKPFTMRLFIWRVGDGFDELFGEADAAGGLFDEQDAGRERASAEVSAEVLANGNGQAIAVGNAEAGFFSMSSVPLASVMLPEGEEERVLSELEQELAKDSLLPASDPDVGESLSFDFDAGLGAASDSAAEKKEANDLDLAADFGLELGDQSTLGSLTAESSSPVDSADALDADLSKGVSFADIPDYPSTEFTLPGEAPDLASSDLDLPTVDLPITMPAVDETKSPDFFNLVDDSALLDPEETSSTEMLLDVYGDPGDWALATDLTSNATDAEGAGPADAPSEDSEASSDLFDLLSFDPAAATDSSESSEAGFAIADTVIQTRSPEDFFPDSGVDDSSANDVPPEAVAFPIDPLAGDPALDDSALDDSALDDSALDDSALDDSALDDSALDDLALSPLASDDLVPDDLSDLSLDASELAERDAMPSVAIEDLVEAPVASPSFAAPEAPSVEAPSVEAPSIEAPSIESPSIEVPIVEAPSNESGDELGDVSIAEGSVPLADADQRDFDSSLRESVLETHGADDLALTFNPVAENDDESAGYEPTEYELDESAGYVPTDSASTDPVSTDPASTDYAPTEYDPADYEYEEVTHDHEAYADDPVYYLEDDGAHAYADEAEDYEEVVAAVDETEVQRQRELWQQQTKSSGNPLILVGAVGLLFAGVVGFFLTRPCTVGGCDRLEVAQLKGEEALDNLRIDDSFDAVTESKKELKESVLLLEPIPVWSSYYDDAQAILPEYDRQLSALDLVSEAQGKAYSAAVASQNPPHSVSKWQKIASDWRGATTALSGVAEDSPVRELANRKLVEYRANLSTVLVRIESESGAEVSLRQAQQAASQATQQTSKADSAEAWEVVLSDWESAVENLRRIPQGTSAYAEAQQLLPEFEATLQDVRDRAEQERSAGRMLFRAQQLADDAQKAEDEELWTSAVERWNLAVIQLKDVPEGVFARSTAQSLLTTYTGALAVAENNMQVSLRFQPVEPSFYLVCGLSDVQKCSYSMKSGKVRLDLVQGYDSVINESITPPPQRTGLNTSAQLVSQGNQLLQQITLLSTQAQIPIELYDANGDFLARYRPDLDGFVRQ